MRTGLKKQNYDHYDVIFNLPHLAKFKKKVLVPGSTRVKCRILSAIRKPKILKDVEGESVNVMEVKNKLLVKCQVILKTDKVKPIQIAVEFTHKENKNFTGLRMVMMVESGKSKIEHRFSQSFKNFVTDGFKVNPRYSNRIYS